MNTFAHKSYNLVIWECKAPITTTGEIFHLTPACLELLNISYEFHKVCHARRVLSAEWKHCPICHLDMKRVSRLEISILTLTITVSPTARHSPWASDMSFADMSFWQQVWDATTNGSGGQGFTCSSDLVKGLPLNWFDQHWHVKLGMLQQSF